MIRKNDWITFPNGLAEDACDKLIRQAEDKLESADEETHDRPLENLEDSKKTDIVWTEDQWIYDAVWKYMVQANENAEWKYEISAADRMQLARYKKGMFYNWHSDSRADAYNNPANKLTLGRIRKLTMTCILNDDFEGGEFQMIKYDHFTPLKRESWIDQFPDNHISTVEYKKGTIIVYPSDIFHRVKPVTKGIRYSLSLWFLGLPYV